MGSRNLNPPPRCLTLNQHLVIRLQQTQRIPRNRPVVCLLFSTHHGPRIRLVVSHNQVVLSAITERPTATPIFHLKRPTTADQQKPHRTEPTSQGPTSAPAPTGKP